MAFNTPKYREIPFDTIDAPIVRGRGTAQYDFFKAKRPSGLLVVLWHGWLGDKTLRPVADEVRKDGHDVVVIGKPERHAHSMIKHAVNMTGESDVVVWDHSDGHRHVSEMLEHQLGRSDEDLTYRIRAVLATASVGTNGKRINPFGIHRELIGQAQLLRNHPREQVRVMAQSVQNYLEDPVRSAISGLRAATYRSAYTAGVHDGVEVVETYFDDDYVIEPPADRSKATILPGSHMTPVVDPDVARETIKRITTL